MSEPKKEGIRGIHQEAVISFVVPQAYISEMWGYLKNSLSSRKKMQLSNNTFSVTLEEGEVDKIYSLIERFAKMRNLTVGSYSNEKLKFLDLKTGDIFISFPSSGDNSGHGGFLDAYHSFVKIDEDEDGNNAERANGTRVRTRFHPDFIVLMID